jgi:serine/threonine protein kinase
MEYCSNGSLLNLINSVGVLSEDILKKISLNLLKHVESFHKTAVNDSLLILPENIMFDNKYNIKLQLGENQLIDDKFNLIKMRSVLKEQWITNILQKNNKITETKINQKLNIFDIGCIIIQCAVGSSDFYNFAEYQCTCIQLNKNEKCCCLYHCIIKYEQQQTNIIKLVDLINNSLFSQEFINFICEATSYDYKQDFSIKNLKSHLWIMGNNENTSNKVKVFLEEYIALSKDYNFQNEYIISNDNSMCRFDKFCENISIILSDWTSYYEHYNIRHLNEIFNSTNDLNELSREFGIEKDIIINKLKPLYSNYLI